MSGSETRLATSVLSRSSSALRRVAHRNAGRAPSSISAWVTALRDLTPRLADKAGEVAEAARAELAGREDVWQPFAEQIAAFVPHARSARDIVPLWGHLKTGAD